MRSLAMRSPAMRSNDEPSMGQATSVRVFPGAGAGRTTRSRPRRYPPAMRLPVLPPVEPMV